MTNRQDLEARAAQLEAELDRRKTPSQRQADFALKANSPSTEAGRSVSQRQADLAQGIDRSEIVAEDEDRDAEDRSVSVSERQAAAARTPHPRGRRWEEVR